MARIEESQFGATAFQRLLGHNKEIMIMWSRLGNELEKEGKLTAHLKEQVRRTLAQSSGCAYCKAKGKPEPNLYDEKISIAVGFAEVFIKQKGDVPDAIFKVLKEYMSDGEISELCAFITFATASQYFGAIMKLEAQATDI